MIYISIKLLLNLKGVFKLQTSKLQKICDDFFRTHFLTIECHYYYCLNKNDIRNINTFSSTSQNFLYQCKCPDYNI